MAAAIVKEIAERVGMSQSTVSIVLNGRGDEMRISEKTQERIRREAEKLGYRPKPRKEKEKNGKDPGGPAQVLLLWNEKLLGVDIAHFLKGAFQKIEKEQYRIELTVRFFKEDRLDEKLSEADTAKYIGALVSGPSVRDAENLEASFPGLPVIVMNRTGMQLSSIYVDGYELGKKTARLFSEKGLKKPALVMQRHSSTGCRFRAMGFTEGCHDYGLILDEKDNVILENPDTEETIRKTEEVMKKEDRPDCLFVQHLDAVPGVLEALRGLRLRVPDDVSIIAYGPDVAARNYYPSITTVGGRFEDYGETSTELLMTLITKQIATPMNKIIPAVFSFHDSFRQD